MLRRWIPVLLISIAAGTADAAWLPEERLTERPSQHDRTTRTNARAVAIDTAGNVHVVWYGGADGIYQVWYSRRDVLTNTWSEDTIISTELDGACFPCIAADAAGSVHVLWQVGAVTNGCTLRYRRRDAVTGHWDTLEMVAAGVHVEHPSIAVRDAGFVVAAWEQLAPSTYENVFVSTRAAGGWQTPEQVSEVTSYGDVQASVALGADSTIGVLWRQGSSTSGPMLFRVRKDTLSEEVDTLQVGFACFLPSLYVQPNGVWHAVWQGRFSGGFGDYVIYCQRRNEAWQDTVVLPRVSRYPCEASVCADQQGNVHAVWMDELTGSPELHYSTADSAGSNWSVPCRLTDARDRREYPTITSGPTGNLAVVWTDYRASSCPDIYCRRQGPARDIALTEIIAPRPVVDSGEVIVPIVVVENHGEQVESFPVWFRLPDGYLDVASVVALAPGAADTVTFAPWSAGRPGWHPMTCSTSAVADTFPDDNVLHDSFFVRLRDVAVDSLVAPEYVVRGDAILLRAHVRNRGSVTADLQSWFRVWDSLGGLVHAESVQVDLGPSACTTLVDRFAATDTGFFTARCSLAAAGDVHPENDTASAGFLVYQPDVEVTEILRPEPQEDSGAVVIPAFRVENSGPVSAGFQAWYEIGAGYVEMLDVDSLAPGQDTVLEFPSWLAETRGWNALRCSLFLVPESIVGDVARGSTFVRVLDAAVDSIVAPRGALAVDTVVPQVRVRNPGNDTAQFGVRFRILREDSSVVYDENIGVELGPGSTRGLEFPAWCGVEGSYLALCSLGLAGDMVPGNDTASVRFLVYQPDVEVTEILRPESQEDSGTVVIPAFRVRNSGPVSAEFQAWYEIGAGYVDSLYVQALASGRDTILEFGEWTALERGLHALGCSLFMVPESIVRHGLRGSTFVRVLDAAVDSIVAPRGALAADTVVPQVRVCNPGNDSAQFGVRFRILREDSLVVYEESTAVELGPGSTRGLEFPAWCGTEGSYLALCSLGLAGDMVPVNDTASARFTLHGGDVWITAITAPGLAVDSGDVVRPGVAVHNYGVQAVSFAAGFTIADGYADSLYVQALASGRDTIVEFSAWVALERGLHALRCSLRLVPAGTVVGPVPGSTFVRVVDAAADSILVPFGTIAPGAVQPRVRFSNPGTESGRATVRVWIVPEGRDYEDSVEVMLAPGRDTVVEFAVWDAEPGRYELAALVAFPGDMVPGNDTARASVVVESLVGSAWVRRADVPRAPDGKRTGRGGALVATGTLVHAFKGRRSHAWYAYAPGSDSWTELAPIPGEKPVRDGAALCCDGEGFVYALKGRVTREFWRYSVSRDSWEACRSLPDGTRPVRYGTGLVFVEGDTDRVFMVKGSGTLEFLEYLVGFDRWHARRPVPHGPEGRECRHGTALCVFQGRVFCLKGGSDEFYEYVPEQDAWFERANLPRASRSGLNRRSGKGAALASDPSGGIYALKGRSTREFWHYDPGTDAWVQLDDLPFGPDRRRVRRGSALAWSDDGVFALKGGPYCELWCYDPEAVVLQRPVRSGVLVSGERCHVPGVRFVPGQGVVVTVSPARAGGVRVYDAAGRRVWCQLEVGQDCVVLSGFDRPGVYFIARSGERGSAKVVVLR